MHLFMIFTSLVRAPRRVVANTGFLGLMLAGLLMPSAWGQITLIQAASCGKMGFPGTCSLTSTGTGHLIVVGWQAAGGTGTGNTISSITDNKGNTYVQAIGARSIDSVNSAFQDIWYAKNSIAGATTVTITPSASIQGGAVIWEFAGVDTTAPLDKTANLSSQASSTSVSGAPVTTANSNEVVIASSLVVNSASLNSGTSFVTDSALMSNGWAHAVTTATGTYQAKWTQSPTGTYQSSTASFKAAASPCDLNSDGVVNSTDVNLAVNMVLNPSSCTANINGTNVCNVVVVQRVVNASMTGGACVIGNAHSVTVNWAASTSTNISGYNVYRSTISGSNYGKINSTLVSALTYVDSTVQAGTTYYYVVTAVDVNGNESAYSTPPATAAVPYP